MRVRCRNTPHKSRTIFYNSPIWKIYTKLCNNNSPTCLPPSNCYFGNHPRQWLLPHHCDWKRESFVTISDTFRFQHPSCSPLLRNWTLPSSVPSNGMSYSYCLIIKRGRKGTLERKQPTQFSASWKPPLAPFPKSSNGGLTIWLSFGFVLPSPICHIAVSKGASATVSYSHSIMCRNRLSVSYPSFKALQGTFKGGISTVKVHKVTYNFS